MSDNGGWRAKRLAMLVLAAALALFLAACGEDTSGDSADDEGGDDSGSDTLTISNWDQYMPEDLIPGFEKETGIKVDYVKHATNEEVMGKYLEEGTSKMAAQPYMRPALYQSRSSDMKTKAGA